MSLNFFLNNKKVTRTTLPSRYVKPSFASSLSKNDDCNIIVLTNGKESPSRNENNNMVMDDSLTSLAWLQNLNIMKGVSVSTPLAENVSEISEKRKNGINKNDSACKHLKSKNLNHKQDAIIESCALELDSATIPAATNHERLSCSATQNQFINKEKCSIFSKQSFRHNVPFEQTNELNKTFINSNLNSPPNSKNNSISPLRSSPETFSFYHIYPSPPTSCSSPLQNCDNKSNTNVLRIISEKNIQSSTSYNFDHLKKFNPEKKNQFDKKSLKCTKSVLNFIENHSNSDSNSKGDNEDYRKSVNVKPPFSYSQLIIMAMKESKYSKMTLQMIYDWIIDNFIYFKKADASWQVTFKNSIRHNLSLNKCFKKIPRQKNEPGKGGFWTLDPEYNKQIETSSSIIGNNNFSQNKRKFYKRGTKFHLENSINHANNKKKLNNLKDIKNKTGAHGKRVNKNTFKPHENDISYNLINSEDSDIKEISWNTGNDAQKTYFRGDIDENLNDFNQNPKPMSSFVFDKESSVNDMFLANNFRGKFKDSLQSMQKFSMYPIDLDSSGEGQVVLRPDKNWSSVNINKEFVNSNQYKLQSLDDHDNEFLDYSLNSHKQSIKRISNELMAHHQEFIMKKTDNISENELNQLNDNHLAEQKYSEDDCHDEISIIKTPTDKNSLSGYSPAFLSYNQSQNHENFFYYKNDIGSRFNINHDVNRCIQDDQVTSTRFFKGESNDTHENQFKQFLSNSYANNNSNEKIESKSLFNNYNDKSGIHNDYSTSFTMELMKTVEESSFNLETLDCNFDIENIDVDPTDIDDSLENTNNNSNEDVALNELLQFTNHTTSKKLNVTEKNNNDTLFQDEFDDNFIQFFDFNNDINITSSGDESSLDKITNSKLDLTVEGHRIEPPNWWLDESKQTNYKIQDKLDFIDSFPSNQIKSPMVFSENTLIDKNAKVTGDKYHFVNFKSHSTVFNYNGNTSEENIHVQNEFASLINNEKSSNLNKISNTKIFELRRSSNINAKLYPPNAISSKNNKNSTSFIKT